MPLLWERPKAVTPQANSLLPQLHLERTYRGSSRTIADRHCDQHDRWLPEWSDDGDGALDAQDPRYEQEARRWRRDEKMVASLKEADTDWAKWLLDRPKVAFDPRKYLAPARQMVKDLVRHKVKNVLCCAGHAFD